MSFSAVAFQWMQDRFVPIKPATVPEILVADSWRVRDGETWGLADHIDRFHTGVVKQSRTVGPLPDFDAELFASAIAQKLRSIGQHYPAIDFFPRISAERYQGHPRIVLLVRPAPTIRTTTTLLVPEYTDPRIRPTVKGPDIDLMRRLVSEAAADDVVLHDGTNVSETTTGALLVWQTPKHLVLCQASRQLASISAQRIAHHATSENISVTTRSVTIQELASGEYPVWFSNTLHGISPVTTIISATGERPVAPHPDAAEWQAAWGRRFGG